MALSLEAPRPFIPRLSKDELAEVIAFKLPGMDAHILLRNCSVPLFEKRG